MIAAFSSASMAAESHALMRRRSNDPNEAIFLTDLDMVAAQQLLDLSDDDNSTFSSSSSTTANTANKNVNEENKMFDKDEGEEFDRKRSSQEEITSKKIEEIFGKIDEEFDDDGNDRRRRRNQREKKFRSLANIYQATTPVSGGSRSRCGNNGKKVIH